MSQQFEYQIFIANYQSRALSELRFEERPSQTVLDEIAREIRLSVGLPMFSGIKASWNAALVVVGLSMIRVLPFVKIRICAVNGPLRSPGLKAPYIIECLKNEYGIDARDFDRRLVYVNRDHHGALMGDLDGAM